MSEASIVEVRKFKISDDQVLEIEMTQLFIDRVRQHFGLFGDQPLEDDQVRMYVLGAVNTAVTKAEAEIDKNETKPAADPARVRRTGRRKKGA